MQAESMTLRILLPFKSFLEKSGITRIVAETSTGSFGLLPHRLDCVAALTQGILTYQAAGESEVFVAVDRGVLIKAGTTVSVSVRGALAGSDLGRLRQAMQTEFSAEDATDESMRAVMAKIETGLMTQLKHLQNE
jgi:F-type H+-transporting ATPase subunit epsilon